MIYRANQLTGFYVTVALTVNGVSCVSTKNSGSLECKYQLGNRIFSSENMLLPGQNMSVIRVTNNIVFNGKTKLIFQWL